MIHVVQGLLPHSAHTAYLSFFYHCPLPPTAPFLVACPTPPCFSCLRAIGMRVALQGRLGGAVGRVRLSLRGCPWRSAEGAAICKSAQFMKSVHPGPTDQGNLCRAERFPFYWGCVMPPRWCRLPTALPRRMAATAGRRVASLPSLSPNCWVANTAGLQTWRPPGLGGWAQRTS